MRRPLLVASLAAALLTPLGLAACGGDDDGDATSSSPAPPAASAPAATSAAGAASTPPATAEATTGASPSSEGAQTLRQLLGLPDDNLVTPDVALLGGADFATGKTTRIPFAVVGKEDGAAVEPDGDRAQVYLAANPDAAVIGPFSATYHSLDVPGARFEAGIPTSIWVADVDLPAAGPYFLVARYTVDGKERSANTGLNVQPQESTPAVGDPAPNTPTPTIDSTGGNLAALTTADPPDTSLLQYSVADTLAAKKAFVVVFATPKFCQSRICGPVVDIMLDVQKRMADTDMRFIHAEIYRDNDPSKGVSDWITSWGLISEPWVFVVKADGTIAAKFEGAVSAEELESAARGAL